MNVSRKRQGASLSLSHPLHTLSDDKVINKNKQVMLPLRFTTRQNRRPYRINSRERNHLILQTNPMAKVEQCVIQHLLGSNRRSSKRHPNRQRSIRRRKTPFPPTALIQIVSKRTWIHRPSEARSPQSFLLPWQHQTSLQPKHAITVRFALLQIAAKVHLLLESLVTTC